MSPALRADQCHRVPVAPTARRAEGRGGNELQEDLIALRRKVQDKTLLHTLVIAAMENYAKNAQ